LTWLATGYRIEPVEGRAPLVGRDGELAVLGAALDALDAGRSAALAIAGEPGIGKTRLLAELGGEADARGWLVLEGRATELEGEVPFGVWVDALDPYLGSLAQPRVRALPESHHPELAAVFPSLAWLGGERVSRLEAERYRAHRAVRELLDMLARETPCVLLLDDMHWADGASLELLVHLLRRRSDRPLLLALALRTEPEPHALLEALAEGDVELVEPRRLDRDEAARLLGPEVGPVRAEELHRESGGNPFYLEQLARLPGGGGEATAAAWGDALPDAVRRALAGELDALPAETLAVLRAAALVGDPFEPDLAAEVAEVEEARALAAIDAGLERGILRPTAVPRQFAFRHPIVRRAVYESAGVGWRVGGHGRAAAALAERGAPAPARAHHVERSARDGDEAAIALLAEAARESAPLAPASAAAWYAGALRLLPHGADAGRRIALLAPLAQALGSTGRLEESRAALEELLGLLPEDAAEPRARIAGFVALVDHLLGRHGRAAAVLEQLPETGPEAALEMAADRYFVGDWDGMRDWAVRARGLVGDDPGRRAVAAALLGLAEYSVARVPEARAPMDEAAALVDSIEGVRLDALDFLGWCEISMERYAAALGHHDRGLALGRATGQGHLVITMTFGRVLALLWTGLLDEAEQATEEALELARLSGSDQLRSWALTLRSVVSLRLGRLEEAIAAGERAAELDTGLDGNPFSRVGAGYLGEARVEAGAPARGRDEILAALGGPELPGVESAYRSYFYDVLARAELARGRLEEAERWARLAERTLVDLDGRRGWALRARAEVELARGDAEAAAATALEAAEAGAVHPIDSARCRILAGRALAAAAAAGAERSARGGAALRARAEAELERARGELDACGADRYRDEAIRELRRLGRHVPRPGRRGGDGEGLDALSDREREIAELVRDRLTNREIAERLVLSEKTVERHLSSIFRKLGASSRVEVARRLEAAARQGGATSVA
jgi:DNA-binding CsgD family transcriptional regulator/tetratricopeptide (TPR) repeat protein